MLAFDGVAEWLVMLPVCAAAIRVIPTWRSMLDALCRPVSAAIVLAGAWGLLSLAWSSDPANGLDELSAFRHALLMLALWPLREHRSLLIAALAIGFALGHLTQIGHAVGVWGRVEWLKWPRLPDRNSGWWDPVVGGSLLTAAVGLHLPAAMWGRGRARWLGVAGACAALGGVVATGTRGAWIATGALLFVAGVCGAWRWTARARGHPRPSLASPATWIALAVAALTILTAGIAAGPEVVGRAGRGIAEIRRAVDDGDFTSDTGRRMFMWLESWRAFKSHPLGGLGAGGLNDWAEAGAAGRGLDPALVLPHAHGMWVHLAATQGAVGVAWWLGVVGVAVVCGIVVPTRPSGRAAGGATNLEAGSEPDISDFKAELARAYSLAPVFALIGLTLSGVFDTVHVNSQTAMLLFALIALCTMGRQGRDVAVLE